MCKYDFSCSTNYNCLTPWHHLNVSSLDGDLVHFRIFIQFLHFCRFANSEAVHVLFRWVCGWPCWVVLNTALLLLYLYADIPYFAQNGLVWTLWGGVRKENEKPLKLVPRIQTDGAIHGRIYGFVKMVLAKCTLKLLR